MQSAWITQFLCQIIQDRIRELTSQLSNPLGHPSGMVDQKHKDEIKKLENERRITIETALNEAEVST